MRYFSIMGSISLLLCLANPIYAQTGAQRSEVERVRAAAEEFDAGRRAFNANEFANAAEHFENADRDAPAPEALRMAIRARMAAKHHDRAATLAAAALARYPNDKTTVTFAKQTLAKVPKRLHRITVLCDEPCSLIVDRRLLPWAEKSESMIYVEPGSHDITAGWSEGREQTKQLEVSPAGESELSFEAPHEPTPEPESEEPEPELEEPEKTPDSEPDAKPLPPGVFYGALGVTAVLSGVTVWSTLDMRANPGKDKVREDCAGRDESCPTYQDALSSQQRTNVLLVATGITAAGTALIGALFTDWSASHPEEATSRIVPILNLDQGVFLGASGRF